VNTPLAVISTYAQMLAKQISGDEQKAPLLEKIARQTFRASEIVNSLLNFSRVSPTEFVAVDLNKVVRETVTLLEHQLHKSQVKLELGLHEPLTPLKGNAGKLQQVMLNLILNARDAMPSGGTLTILTSQHDGEARVIVADTGTGIPAHVLPRIFDPFFTTKNEATITPQGSRQGTGLGLSVSYGIVREHGGEIEVESVVGQGTRFLLTFPLPGAIAKPTPVREAAVLTSSPAASPVGTTVVVARSDTPSVPAAISAQSNRIIQ
jgi:signal transduction histidine kinase